MIPKISLREIVINSRSLIKESFKIDFKFIPRVSSSTDINTSTILGCKILKLFPTIQLETNREFFDFEAKYTDEDSRIICPPELSEEKLTELEILVKRAYDSLGCKGLARVDVMQGLDGEFYLIQEWKVQ